MSATEDATINPDGSTNFEDPPGTQNAGTHGADEPPFMGGDTMNDTAEKLANQGIDPALYLLLAGLILGALYYYFVYRKKSDESDEFFTELDGDKVCAINEKISLSRCSRCVSSLSHLQDLHFFTTFSIV